MPEREHIIAKKKNISVMFTLLVTLLAAGAGAGGGIAIGKKSVQYSRSESDAHKLSQYEEEAVPAIKSLMPLGESLVLNLTDRDSRAYLRVGVQLGLANEAKQKSDEALDIIPIARDSTVAIFSSKTSDELLSAEGKVKAKDELKAELRRRLPQQVVKEVYFTEFLVQR